MSIILSVLTDRSCGESCWHAKEEVCRCECGGVNHGILLKDGSEQPARHSKIDGMAFELVAVGQYRDMRDRAYQLIKENDYHYTYKSPYDSTYQKKVMFDPSDKGSPIRLKKATKAQCVLWSELSQYKTISEFEFTVRGPYLLWKQYK